MAAMPNPLWLGSDFNEDTMIPFSNETIVKEYDVEFYMKRGLY